jgi:hypothetical protein
MVARSLLHGRRARDWWERIRSNYKKNMQTNPHFILFVKW